MGDGAAPTVRVRVNGRELELPAGASVADVVAAWGVGTHGLAVARNREVVPRSAWAGERVSTGDRIEIVTAAAGG